MKILGINISHNASICEITDGVIDFYLEEDRFNKIKNWCPNPKEKTKFKSITEYVDDVYDKVIYSSYDRKVPFRKDSEHDDYFIIKDLNAQLGCIDYIFNPLQHHLYHAYCGFYFSQMNDAICIVMDGGGAQPYGDYFQEVESVYYLTKEKSVCFYKHLTNIRWAKHPETKLITQSHMKNIDGVEVEFSSKQSSGQKFSALTSFLGLGSGNESGKTMGLASYGKLTGDRPQDLARQLQEETKLETMELIRKAISYNDCKNIVLSGGYALNCVNNYEYLKEFPEHNFFVDPVAHDGGTAIGAALWTYQNAK